MFPFTNLFEDVGFSPDAYTGSMLWYMSLKAWDMFKIIPLVILWKMDRGILPQPSRKPFRGIFRCTYSRSLDPDSWTASVCWCHNLLWVTFLPCSILSTIKKGLAFLKIACIFKFTFLLPPSSSKA
jgi:hypothetical protein